MPTAGERETDTETAADARMASVNRGWYRILYVIVHVCGGLDVILRCVTTDRVWLADAANAARSLHNDAKVATC